MRRELEQPYLVVIAPGIYSIESTINMKPYVEVSGSGQNATVLNGSVSTLSRVDSAVLNGSRNSSVRRLTTRHASTSGNRSRITGIDISASTAAIRSSNSTSATDGHTFISNAVFRDGLVQGQASKLHCSHVFDESTVSAPVELESACSN